MHGENMRLTIMKQQIAALQKAMYDLLCETTTPLIKGELKMSDGDLVDMGCLCKDIEEMADEIRKDAKDRGKRCGKIISMKWAEANMAAPGSAEGTVKGELGSAFPDVKNVVAVPKRDTLEWAAFMAYVDAPQWMYDMDAPFKLDWNAMCEWVSKRTREGKPLPPGLKLHAPEFISTFRRSAAKKDKKETDTAAV